MPVTKSRSIAFACLRDVLINRKTLQLPADAPPLSKELCYGVLRYYFRLRNYCKTLLKKPLEHTDQDLVILFLLGLYQLHFTRIAPHAAIYETVSLCHELKKTWAKSLVNAILRRAQRENTLPIIDDEAKYLHPNWLISNWQQTYSRHWQQIVEHNNQHPPMIVRVNLRHHTQQAYLDKLNEQDIAASCLPNSKTALLLEKPCSVDRLPGFEQGHVSVQDYHAQLCCDYLPIQSGQRILDACAAPGGKSCYLLEQHDLDLWSLDNKQSRLEQLQQNLQRLQLSATVKRADCNELSTWWDDRVFDNIILDAPCSGTGVIRRHPEIKLLRHEKALAKLQQQQMKLLQTLWTTLARDGHLLYITCSLQQIENDSVIDHFLNHQADATCIQLSPIGDTVLSMQHGLQYMPSIGDGFYVSLLKKGT